MESRSETYTGESTKFEPTPPWNLTKTTDHWGQSGGGGSKEDHKLNTQGLYK